RSDGSAATATAAFPARIIARTSPPSASPTAGRSERMRSDIPNPRKPRRAAILMYHALSRGHAPPGQDPHYTLDETVFEGQLRQVQRAGGACSVRDWLRDGERRPVLVTFDDGHASNYEVAFPALAGHGMRADFFVNPANVGSPGFATWAQLREMSDAGMSIQSHGYDH